MNSSEHTDADCKVMQINLNSVLRDKWPNLHLPRFVVRWLERVICVDRLNQVLKDIGTQRGADAAHTALQSLNVGVRVDGMQFLPDNNNTRYIFVSNHPLGGLDGLALIDLLGHRFPQQLRFLVNDLLMAVRPLNDVFLPVNMHGSQSRTNTQAIAHVAGGNCQLAIFPAGLCSRRQPDGTIADLPWHKWVVRTATQFRRNVVPIYVDAANSNTFYRLAYWRKRLGIKFNAEMVLLPREMVQQQGRSLHLIVGQPIDYSTLQQQPSADHALQLLRDAVYRLAPVS